MHERPLEDVSSDILAAVHLLKQYGAEMTYESRKPGRQQENQPVRVYTIPGRANAQVALRMNKNKTTIYVRNTSTAGVNIEEELRAIGSVAIRYTGEETYKAPRSLTGTRAPYLKPAPDNVLIKIDTKPGAYEKVFELVLGSRVASLLPTSHAGKDERLRRRKGPDLKTLLDQLDRKSATGSKGEDAAMEYERQRLGRLSPPCPEPSAYVKQISIDDVSVGYDIESTWPDNERCIEVKATTSPGSDLFLSENERQVLSELGNRAWIYRIALLPDGRSIVREIQNPIGKFEGKMTTSVWRVSDVT